MKLARRSSVVTATGSYRSNGLPLVINLSRKRVLLGRLSLQPT